jgi:glycosyltransferase involved in cell wall biosynthesis
MSMPGKPMLSIIVPSHNSSGQLKRCLSAIADSDYSRFEVIVVDDGSAEPLDPLPQDTRFRSIRVEVPCGPAHVRNLAAANCCGEFLVFVDADVCIHRETLTQFANIFASDPTVSAVVGAYDDCPDAVDFVSQYKNLFHSYIHQSNHGEICSFWTGCGAIRRDVFLSVGGFDNTRYIHPSVEDIDLGHKITSRGHRVVLDQHIQAKHLKRWTFWSLLKTDIFDRGIPWTRLMLHNGCFPNILNVSMSQRISVTLAVLAVLAASTVSASPLAGITAMLFTVLVVFQNRGLYRFFWRRKGMWFALRVIPMHCLYLLYCGLAFAVGLVLHYLVDVRAERSLSTVHEREAVPEKQVLQRP